MSKPKLQSYNEWLKVEENSPIGWCPNVALGVDIPVISIPLASDVVIQVPGTGFEVLSARSGTNLMFPNGEAVQTSVAMDVIGLLLGAKLTLKDMGVARLKTERVVIRPGVGRYFLTDYPGSHQRVGYHRAFESYNFEIDGGSTFGAYLGIDLVPFTRGAWSPVLSLGGRWLRFDDVRYTIGGYKPLPGSTPGLAPYPPEANFSGFFVRLGFDTRLGK